MSNVTGGAPCSMNSLEPAVARAVREELAHGSPRKHTTENALFVLYEAHSPAFCLPRFADPVRVAGEGWRVTCTIDARFSWIPIGEQTTALALDGVSVSRETARARAAWRAFGWLSARCPSIGHQQDRLLFRRVIVGVIAVLSLIGAFASATMIHFATTGRTVSDFAATVVTIWSVFVALACGVFFTMNRT
jgi:hypothetical protein